MFGFKLVSLVVFALAVSATPSVYAGDDESDLPFYKNRFSVSGGVGNGFDFAAAGRLKGWAFRKGIIQEPWQPLPPKNFQIGMLALIPDARLQVQTDFDGSTAFAGKFDFFRALELEAAADRQRYDSEEEFILGSIGADLEHNQPFGFSFVGAHFGSGIHVRHEMGAHRDYCGCSPYKRYIGELEVSNFFYDADLDVDTGYGAFSRDGESEVVTRAILRLEAKLGLILIHSWTDKPVAYPYIGGSVQLTGYDGDQMRYQMQDFSISAGVDRIAGSNVSVYYKKSWNHFSNGEGTPLNSVVRDRVGASVAF